MYATKSTIATKAVRVDQKTREAQARLSEKSFSAFMREHNAKLARIAQRGA